MADQKITDLVDGDPLQPTDEFVVARGGDNFKIDGAAVVDAATAAVTKHDVTLAGNTAGVLALVSSGTLSLAGGNNITLSQAGNAVTISGAAAGGAQTAISGIANSETTYTSGTVSLSELGAVTIRSTTGNQFQISVNSQSVQPETQTFIAGISASDTLYTSGNVRITGVGGGVTVSSNTGQRVDISVAAQSVQPETQTFIAGVSASDTLYTSGNVRITGSQAVTVRSGTGQLVVIDAPAQSVQPETQTAISGIANSQTTYTSGTVSLSELGAITIRSTTGNQYQLSVNSQTVQTQGVLSVGVSTGGNTAGNTTVNTGSRFVIVGSNGITASQGTAAGATTVTLSGVTQSAQTQGIINAGVSNVGNTSGDTGVNSGTRLVFAGGNNITLSQGTAANATTITISAGAGGAGLSAGMSTNGNTSGDTGFASQRLALIGGNNITLSGSTNGGSMSITVSAPNLGAGAMSAGVSTGGNTAGATGITGTQLVLVGTGPISLSQTTGANGGTVSILAPATSSLSATGGVQISTNGSTISIGAPVLATLADWQNMPIGQAALMTNIAGISKTPFYFNINLPGVIDINSIVFKVSHVTNNTLQSFSAHFGIYSAANSTSMSLIGSFSEAYVVSSASSASFTNVRNYVMTGVGTHTALSVLSGGDYGVGMMFSAGASQSMNMSLMGMSTGSGVLGNIFPGTNQLSAGTSQGAMALWGRGSTTVNALPANVVRSELVNQGSGASVQLVPWIYMRS